MAEYFTREEIHGRLKEQKENGRSILIFGAGNGLSAKSGVQGGADIISVYSTAAIRMRGLPSLLCACPYGDANEEMFRIAKEILPQVEGVPCVAGIGAHNPLDSIEGLIKRAKDMGFSGISNEPFVGIYGTWFAELCEESGIGFSRELELIRKAHEQGLFTLAWVFNEKEAREMTLAGADIIGAMVMNGPASMEKPGYTEECRIQEAVDIINRICDSAKSVREDVIVITHGDPFLDVEAVQRSIHETSAVGYASGSSGERIPTQESIKKQVKEFKSILLQNGESV